MTRPVQRRSQGGWSLVEQLIAMAILGGLLLSVVPVGDQVTREAVRAKAEADALSARWETVRRFRSDAAEARQVRLLQGSSGDSAGVEFSEAFGTVTWVERDGLLDRVAVPGPVVQGVRMDASFAVERRGSRTFLAYEFTDGAGRVSGTVLLGSAP